MDNKSPTINTKKFSFLTVICKQLITHHAVYQSLIKIHSNIVKIIYTYKNSL